MAVRSTIAIVDRIEPNGLGTVHEVASDRVMYFSNTTVTSDSFDGVQIKSRVAVAVEDDGDVLVVKALRRI